MPSKEFMSRLQALAATPVRGMDLPVWIATGMVILGLSIVFNSFGLLHFELSSYIPYHLGPGSVWKKIFDSRTLDLGTYEGRELSYLFDHFDFVMVALSVKWGCPLFVSSTHVGLCVFVGVWVGWFAARDLKLGSLIGILLALLFWTAPFVFIHFLLRTAKVLVAGALVILIVEIYRALSGAKQAGTSRGLPGRFIASITLSAGVMSFADRQGFFFLVVACGLVAFQWLANKDRVAGRILLLLTVVLVIELGYFFWAAPVLTKTFHGYTPDFSFNRLPLDGLWARPVEFAGKSLALLSEEAGKTLGQAPHWAVALMLAGALGISVGRDNRIRAWGGQIPLTALVAAALLAIWAMYALMVLRHPPVLWPDVRLVYYWLPTGALVILGTAAVTSDWAQQSPGRKLALASVLFLLVLRNVAALPGHGKTFAAGHLVHEIEATPAILDALKHRDEPAYVASPEVEKVGAYQFLLNYTPEPENLPALRHEYGHWLLHRYAERPGASVRFVRRIGGNVDVRFLSSSAGFSELEDKRGFLGDTGGHVEMRLNLPTNRLRGEVVLQRTGADASQRLAADFAIYAQNGPDTRYERWTAKVELPAGQKEIVVPYEIDSSHLFTTFTADIAAGFQGLVVAGWRNFYITDVGGDSLAPRWLNESNDPVVVLDEVALARLLPDKWRPVQAVMRGGKLTDTGVELSSGGEIWLQVRGVVSKFAGVATVVAGSEPTRVPEISGVWYKAGRLHTYTAPTLETNTGRWFQAWCAEPGGWIVIAVEPNPGMSPVLVRVTEVKPAG